MKEEILSKIIGIVRNLREDGMVVSGGITNAANSAGLGFDPKKDTPPVFLGGRKKYAFLGPKSRGLWMQKRKPPQ
jgi:hypothetical protein